MVDHHSLPAAVITYTINMQLFVRALGPQTLVLQVDGQGTVHSLKEAIQVSCGPAQVPALRRALQANSMRAPCQAGGSLAPHSPCMRHIARHASG